MHYFKYFIPLVTLSVALALSSVSAYYSVVGLTAIFSGGLIGFILIEVAKIISTIVLHKHWKDGLGMVKGVLVGAVIVSMLITSAGVFGYLSKASTKQSENVTVNSSKVIFIENAIKREEIALERNNKQIENYNTSISRLITDNPTKASRERQRLQKEISNLVKENKQLSANIDKLSNELLPYKTEVNKHEVEIGPLLYITKFIYGENYKAHLEETLSYLIIIIVLILDPLAITLLIASQKSFHIVSSNGSLQKEPTVVEEIEEVKYEEPAIGEIDIPELQQEAEESSPVVSRPRRGKIRNPSMM